MKTPFKTNNYFIFLLALIAMLTMPQLMASDYDYRYGSHSNIVDVQVVNDHGRRFNKYSIDSHKYNVERAYLEAKDGKAYAIKVRNKSNARIGLVIAVDGRNIISGKKSKLKAKERMYILNPYQSATYDGWRSGKNRINEFYFTDVQDSYSDRTFGDRSAMGVIAVAVFKEKGGRWYRDYDYDDYSNKGRSDNRSGESRTSKKSPGLADSPSAQSKSRYEAEKELGTGYGDDRYSPTRRVEFRAEKQATIKHFIKYETKQSLCEMGVTSCRRNRKDRNRFWPREYENYGFVPPPPVSRYRNYGQGIH